VNNTQARFSYGARCLPSLSSADQGAFITLRNPPFPAKTKERSFFEVAHPNPTVLLTIWTGESAPRPAMHKAATEALEHDYK
jgi:hypothetical protein